MSDTNEMRRYQDSDLKEMNDWYARRGMAPMDPSHLPTIGFIVPHVAVGFMYTTDSKLVFLENYVANPDVYSGERYLAFDEITRALFAEAAKMGMVAAIALTNNSKHQSRMMAEYGAAAIGHDYTMMKFEVAPKPKVEVN